MERTTETFDTAEHEDYNLTMVSVTLPQLGGGPYLEVGENPSVPVTEIQLCTGHFQMFKNGEVLASGELTETEYERLKGWLSDNARDTDYIEFDDALEQVKYQDSQE